MMEMMEMITTVVKKTTMMIVSTTDDMDGADGVSSETEEIKRADRKFHSLGISFLSNYNEADANACSIKPFFPFVR